MLHRQFDDLILVSGLHGMWFYFSTILPAVLCNTDNNGHLTPKTAVSDATLSCLHMRFIQFWSAISHKELLQCR